MIDLSRCEDFALGAVTIRPSSREIVNGAIVEMVEPKAMQVLVALAGQPGRVVSRDDLVEQCWSGRVVGDDAVNRVIGKLRRAAEGAAAGAFRIETIPRIGFRLLTGIPVEPSPLSAPNRTVDPVAAPRRSVPRGVAVSVALAIGASAIGVVALRPTSADQRTVPPTPPLPAAVSDLETRGLSAMFENSPEQTAEGVAYLRRAAALAPARAPVWGSLAMGYVLSLGWTPPSERAVVAARVRDAAAHALAIDPAEPRAAAALVSLAPTFGHWGAKAQQLQTATRRARPENGPLQYQTVQFLIDIGRTRDALPRVEQLAKFSPLVPWIQAARIDLLAANGRYDDADRAAEEARALWPRDRLIWFTRFDLAAFGGQPDRALAMAADRSAWPKQTSPDEIALAARTVRAMVGRNPAEIDALLDVYRSTTGRGQAHAERAMRAAAALDRPAAAMDFARSLYNEGLMTEPRATLLPRVGLADDAERPTAALFLPPMQRLWTQPDFLPLLARIGFVDFWRRTRPPDQCLAQAIAPRCREVGIAARDG